MAEKKNGEAAPPQTAEGKPAVKLTKMKAVELAVQALGEDTPRGDLQKYISKEFHIEMTADHISNYKGELKRRAAKGGKKTGKPKAAKTEAAAPAAATPAAPVAAPAVGKRDSVSSTAMQAITIAQDLIKFIGAENAKALIEKLAH